MFAFCDAVFDLVEDDAAQVGVSVHLDFAVADAAVEEIGTIADVALVFVRPLHEAEVAVCWFHGVQSSLSAWTWQ